MKNLKKFALGMTVFICGSSMAIAQTATYDPSWYMAPSIGMMDPDTAFVDDTAPVIGLRAGKMLTQNWDVQFGVTYARVDDAGTRYQQNLFGADALYLFSRDRLRPFLLIGAGAQYDRRTVAGAKTADTAPYINAGLGFQYTVSDNMAIQADYRRVHGFLSDTDFSFNKVNNDYLMVGLNFKFGAP